MAEGEAQARKKRTEAEDAAKATLLGQWWRDAAFWFYEKPRTSLYIIGLWLWFGIQWLVMRRHPSELDIAVAMLIYVIVSVDEEFHDINEKLDQITDKVKYTTREE